MIEWEGCQISQYQHDLRLGSAGEPERVELQHQQADGPRHEDDPSHQQGGNGKCSIIVEGTMFDN